MALEPTTAALLEQMAETGGPALEEMTPAEAREMYRALQPEAPDLPVGHVENRAVPGPAGDIPLRVYYPHPAAGVSPDPATGAARGALPVHVYFHGGGWVIGDLDTHDALCRELCRLAGCIVVSVDYRRAPEHPFPAAVEDCYAATRWASEHAGELGGDPARLSIGGDSAGGNLAAVVAQLARDEGGPALCFQLLLYPATDAAMDTASHRENGEDYLLTRNAIRWFWGHYCPDGDARRSPKASPARAERLAGLPPALVVTAEYDPLRDEGEDYAQRLASAGVAARYRRYDGMIHGFLAMARLIPPAQPALEATAAALSEAHGGAAPG